MCDSGIMPPSGVKLSCIELTDPFDVPVVEPAQSPDAAGPKRTSLPSMFPPRLRRRDLLVRAEVVERRVAVRLRTPSRASDMPAQMTSMIAEHGPALALVADHAAEREGEARTG